MSDHGANIVVGTAGHIDHGKTSMIRRLTGVDLDTLPEERERGITIALGFTPLVLADERRVAFVDVPGHERLVRTMIAGATGVDAVLLCISAVDGAMPQTREHLAILDLLDVRVGAVVLTMADLVDDELLELAREDAADLVEGSFLEGAPIVPFSAVTGQGEDELRAVIATFQRPERDPSGPFRLPVDRAFVRTGFGTVVTGTAWSGRLRSPAQATLLPEGTAVRVRGIEVHGSDSDEARAGWRVALNIAGIERDDVPRGTVIARGDVPCPLMIDVRYHHLASAQPLEDGAPVRVLLGTAERLGRIHAADDVDVFAPGSSTPAQIRLDGPLPCLAGDRFVLRRTSPLETLGGGIVADPYTRRMRRKNRAAWGREVQRLADGDVSVWLERSGEEGLDPADWAARAPGSEAGVELGDRLFAAPVVARLEGQLLEALTSYHAESPLSLGAQRRELRRGRLGHLSDRVFDGLVDRLARTNAVQVEGPVVRVSGWKVALTEAQSALQGRITATIGAAGLGGVSPKVLHETHTEPEVAALVRLVESAGDARQVAGVGWVAESALAELRQALQTWFADHEGLTPGELKSLTGLTRKAAIPLLEWLDANKLTQRHGDTRIKGSRL